jgi:hypothetical protein
MKPMAELLPGIAPVETVTGLTPAGAQTLPPPAAAGYGRLCRMGNRPPEFNAEVPNSARIWNYWLGGKDNFAVDREIGSQVEAMFPQIARVAREQRVFLGRAVGFLAGHAGIRQFLDIGAGLPAADNTHEVAQRIAPGSVVVYVDNDPVVRTHAEALLTSTIGPCVFIEADVRDPGRIISSAATVLDLRQPVGLILAGILGHLPDDAQARDVVRQLTGPLASGSYLVITDGVDIDPAGNKAQEIYNQQSPVPYHLRGPEQLTGFFAGTELVGPGVVSCPRWRPAAGPAAGPVAGDVAVYGGVARTP